MPAAYIFLGDDPLDKKQEEALKKRLDKQQLDLEYELKETALDGKFLDPKVINSRLWPAVLAATKFPPGRKPQKVLSKLEKPGTYALEVEANGYVYKGKIVLKQKSGDTSTPDIKTGSRPGKVAVKIDGANSRRMPQELVRELNFLVNLMKRPASYSYVGGADSAMAWKPVLPKRTAVPQPGGKGWRTRIDASRDTPMMWRLYFTTAFDFESRTLNVTLTRIQEEH